ncbi:MAG: rhamnulose-1-phosphate aldolase [Spirochaetales bacterium]|nr:rhamnulose-1-phosphate aldolase [Spirochaetales bacterium]
MDLQKKYQDILASCFIKEITEATWTMWKTGWAERNAGNISCLIDEDEAGKYMDTNAVKKHTPLQTAVRYLAGRIILVKGTGKYFKNIRRDPAGNLGIVKVSEDGSGLDVLWGFEDGTRATSELPSHLLGHCARLKADPLHRVLIHTHPTNVVAMSAVHRLDGRAFTAALWRMHSECLAVFPDGIGVLPWMVPGTSGLGLKTAEKLKTSRLVVWPLHGIVGTGRSVDEVMGLLETVEKAAGIYMKIKACGHIRNLITVKQLKALAQRFGLNPRKGIIRGL